MKPFQQVLVGVDFSSASRFAVETAIRLAASNGSQVTIAHIIDPWLAAEMKRVNGFSDEQVLENVRQSLHHFLGDSLPKDAPVRFHLAVGHPFAELIAACRRKKASLLVLGTRGIRHEANQVGAVAAKCVRKAPVDVLLVRENAGGPFKKALVCVDFSDTSARAVEMAGQVARCDGTDLDCVFVYQSPMAKAMGYGFAMIGIPGDDQVNMAACQEDLVAFAAPKLGLAGSLKWSSEVCEGLNIRETLVDRAQTGKADLVVIGTHGKTNLETLMIGTTAESMIRHAACSVLAVKPGKLLPGSSSEKRAAVTASHS